MPDALPVHASPSMAATVDDCDAVESLKEFYLIPDDVEVQSFLQQHPYLVPLLEEARTEIGRYFGDDVQVHLAIVDNIESANDREAYVLIQARAPSSNALSALRRLDQRWWLDALERAHGKLTITLRHV